MVFQGLVADLKVESFAGKKKEAGENNKGKESTEPRKRLVKNPAVDKRSTK